MRCVEKFRHHVTCFIFRNLASTHNKTGGGETYKMVLKVLVNLSICYVEKL